MLSRLFATVAQQAPKAAVAATPASAGAPAAPRTSATRATITKPQTARRFASSLNIHEYQSQDLMRKHGLSVANGLPATTAAEAEQVAKQLKVSDLVVKAQIHAGGRGKGTFSSGLKGGVHICTSAEEVGRYAERMLGHTLITKQTGPEGRPVKTVLVAERHFSRREYYFAITLDRAALGPVMIASGRGGVDIEAVAKETPEEIHKEKIDIFAGPQPSQVRSLAERMGFSPRMIDQAVYQMTRLYDVFTKKDCTMLEINPMVETVDNRVICLDAKFNFDPNASFRQPDLELLRDNSQEDAREVQAQKWDLNFIGLDGNIGCMVNGAGLAMATMDVIKLYGGSPANFLDIGGGATQAQVTEAFKILNNDPKVEAILVNIFGGIMRCDQVALGIIGAAKQLGLRVPLVVRLQGTNMKEARDILEASDMRILPADDLDTAASKAVKVAQIVHMAKAANLKVAFELPVL